MAKNGKHAGGRPKGAVSKKTLMLREVATKALEAGVTPLEVMLENMRYFHGQAQELLQKIIVNVDTDKLEEDDRQALLESMKSLGSFRKHAQECAVDAAPYLHAKLSNVTVQGDKDNPLFLVEQDAAYKTIEGTLAKAIASTAAGAVCPSELDQDRETKSADAARRRSKDQEPKSLVDLANARWERVRKNASGR